MAPAAYFYGHAKITFLNRHFYDIFTAPLTLMSNHVHLLFRTGNIPLSTIMRRLLTGYAQQFNRRHKRYGQLFQNRFKSFLCEEEPYLLELVRYIHLNPIRARMVKDLKGLNTYPKTGHSVLMGKIKNDWQDTDYVLKRFGKTLRDARKAYLTFVSKGLSKGRRADLVGGGLLRSVGGWSMLKALLRTAVGPRVSLPRIGDMEPSARTSPLYLPSGVAPVKAPPGHWAEIEIPEALNVPPRQE